MTTARILKAVEAIAESVRSVDSVPSGHLYAMLCGALTLDEYQAAIRALKGANLVSETRNELRWIGPKLPAK